MWCPLVIPSFLNVLLDPSLESMKLAMRVLSVLNARVMMSNMERMCAWWVAGMPSGLWLAGYRSWNFSACWIFFSTVRMDVRYSSSLWRSSVLIFWFSFFASWVMKSRTDLRLACLAASAFGSPDPKIFSNATRGSNSAGMGVDSSRHERLCW